MNKVESVGNFRSRQTILLCCFLIPVALIGCLSLVPRPDFADPFPMFDKVEHTGAYLMLSLLARICLPRVYHKKTLVLLVLLGAGLEVLQGFTPAREPDILDAIFNGLGVCLGGALGAWLRSKLHFVQNMDLAFTSVSATDTGLLATGADMMKHAVAETAVHRIQPLLAGSAAGPVTAPVHIRS